MLRTNIIFDIASELILNTIKLYLHCLDTKNKLLVKLNIERIMSIKIEYYYYRSLLRNKFQ